MKRSFVRGLWGAALVALALTFACRPTESSGPYWLKNQERRADRELVLVLTPPVEEAGKLVRTLRSELSGEFDVHVFAADRAMDEADVATIMRDADPRAVVLVDNPTVQVYGTWARQQRSPPPSLIVMSSFAVELQRTVPNSSGISFEPPAVTSLTDARRVLAVPVQRVGVVYREGFDDYVARERERAALEQISLVAVRVGHTPSPADVHRALEKLTGSKIDALWVSNDNGLLSAKLLEKAWLPFVERRRLPVVVGVPSLVASGPRFGTFAAVPDTEGIGLQAADAIFGLAENDWTVVGAKVQPPVSVKTYVDLESARQLGMKPQAELTVDVLIGKDGADGAP